MHDSHMVRWHHAIAKVAGAVGSIVCVLPFVEVKAQSVRIAGQVHVAGDTARVVADAELRLLPTLRTLRSDSAGRFVFGNVAPGTYTLRARRVGFEVSTQDVKVDVGERGIVAVVIPMRTGARVLAEIKISGERVLYPARLAEPYQRVARGRGAFFTRELIDSLQPWDTFSLLGLVPGVRVSDRAVGIARCANHGASPGMPGNLHVYLDGVRQTNYSGELRNTASDILRDVVISSVQLVEVHTSISTVPPEYASDACAVILVWSR